MKEVVVFFGTKVLILPDLSAGRKNRYTVMVLTSEDPIVTGRELPLDHAQTIAEQCMTRLGEKGWLGGRRQALAILNKMWATARKKKETS